MKKSFLFVKLSFKIFIPLIIFSFFLSNSSPASATNSDYYTMIQGDLPMTYWRTLSGGQILDETSNNNDITNGIGAAVNSSSSSPIANSSDPKSIEFTSTGTKGIITPIDKLDFSNWGTSAGWSWEWWATTTTVSQNQQYMMVFSNADNNLPKYDMWGFGWYNNKYRLVQAYNWGNQVTLLNSPLADTNNWHHYVLTVQPGSARFYLDNQLQITYTGTYPNINNNTLMTLGAYKGDSWPNGDYYSLLGKMSEIALYDYALTPNQITEHYELGKFGLKVKYENPAWVRNDVVSDPIEPEFQGDETSWSFSLATGYSLPDGLSVNSSTGIITGTPTETNEVNTESYPVKIKATKSGDTVLSNEFEIMVRPESLAQQFRPVLRFDEGEDWRPLNVNNFLHEEFDYGEKHEVCPDYSDQGIGCNYYDNWEDFYSSTFPHPGDEDDPEEWPYIDIHGDSDEIEDYKAPELALDNCDAGDLNDCDTGANSVMYWHESPTNSAYNLLDYWVFYRYNKYTVVDGVGILDGDHEADWEEFVVAYTGSNPKTFDWVGMSSHGPVYRYLRGVLTCGDENAEPGSCGDEANPDELGQRPHVFVADGSHANYPFECHSVCSRSEDYTPEKSYGGEEYWGNNNVSTSLKEFNDEEGWDGLNGDWWADWNGYWGLLDNESHVSSPGASNRDPDIYNNSDGDADNIPCREWNSDEFEDCPSNLMRISQQLGINPICAPWIGPGVALVMCEPKKLYESYSKGRLKEIHKEIKITGPYQEKVISSAPGITQVLGNNINKNLKINFLRKGSTVILKSGKYILSFKTAEDSPLNIEKTENGYSVIQNSRQIEKEVVSIKPIR